MAKAIRPTSTGGGKSAITNPTVRHQPKNHPTTRSEKTVHLSKKDFT